MVINKFHFVKSSYIRNSYEFDMEQIATKFVMEK